MSPRHLALAAALLATLVGCGEEAPAAEPAAPPQAPVEAASAAEPEAGFRGTWFLYMPDVPWIAFSLSVLPTADGTRASWISFDWSASKERDVLSSRSKPVTVTLEGDELGLVLQGPSPMLTERGQPNGQRGEWRIELHPALQGPARMVGRAVHPELTGLQGVPAEMTRDFRAWSSP